MMGPIPLAISAACLAALSVTAPLSTAIARRQRVVAERITRVVRVMTPGRRPVKEQAAGFAPRALAFIGRVLAGSGLLPAATLEQLRGTLEGTILEGGNGLAIFIGAKALLLPSGTLLGWLAGGLAGLHGGFHLMVTAAFCIAGLLAPDQTVRTLRRRYVAAVEAGLADALDMLVICAEAGLGLEAGIGRVALEMGKTRPATARELGITAREFRLVADRRRVLHALAARTGLPALRRLATTLIQATQFGTPLTQALRTLSAELRDEAMTRFEARAARLPVMLTLPMILFILPCVFIIAAGPAILQIGHALVSK